MFTNSNITKEISNYLDIDDLYNLGQSGICKIDYVNLNKMLEFIKKYPKIKYMPYIISENKKYEGIENITYLASENQIKIMKQIWQKIEKKHIKKIIRDAAKNGHINIIQYLYENKDFKEFIHLENNYVLINTAKKGRCELIEFLHKKMGMTKKDVQENDNEALRFASYFGNLSVIEYLHEKMGLTKEDAKAKNNYALRWASHNGHLNVVQYLHEKMGLTKEDVWTAYISALSMASENGHTDVVEYLYQNFDIKQS